MTSISIAGRRLAAQEALILLLAMATFVAAVAPALRETGTPPGWDQSIHLRDSLVYERILRHPALVGGGVLGAILRGSEEFPLLTPSGYYPPFVPGITALFYLVAGRSYETAMAAQILFLAFLVFGTWGLGNRLLGAPVGLAAGLMLLAAPGIRMNAEEYMLDLPLAAMVVTSAWALWSSDGFVRRDRSLLFGVLAGVGMLTKWSFFLFLALPVAWVLVWPPTASPAPRGRRWGNVALALLAGGAVAAPYYLPILPILIRKTIVHAGGAADGVASPFTSSSASYHLEALPRKLFGWPLTITAAAGIAGFLWRGEGSRRVRTLLLAWASSLYLIFSFLVANKQSRYLLPWIPVILLMAAGGLAAMWRRAAAGRELLAMGMLILLPATGLAGSWRTEDRGDWNIRPLVARLGKAVDGRSDLQGRTPMLGVIPDTREVNGPTIAYYAARQGLPVTVVQLVNRMKRYVAVDVGLDPFGRDDFYKAFDRYDFVATKDGVNAVPPWEEVVPGMQAYFEQRISEFEMLASFKEPDGSTLALYERKRG
jgi:dolichyl-phosphate-mannose-protein mannosyltransferase